ncbi:serine/arginine repetitive matrix protein 1-like [Triticum dicoccoides]|uniref:serine/arginine repetitive matrix protein 1-like n=1 Tax=Triticum dicoccoides TaxID=85692 RepID=UPI00188F05EE|nr:serine/arginine repetitive matrix protein 1-like [Triticum dicoccoides]
MLRPRAPASAAHFVAAKLAAQGISAHQVDPRLPQPPPAPPPRRRFLRRLRRRQARCPRNQHPSGRPRLPQPPPAPPLRRRFLRPRAPCPRPSRHPSPRHQVRAARGWGSPKRPPPSTAPEGGDRLVEERKPPAEIPWYETGEMDESYRQLLRHTHKDGDTLVLEIQGEVVRYGQEADAEKKDGEEAAARAAPGQNGGGVRKGKGKRKVGRPALKARVLDSPPHWQKGRKEKKGGEHGGKKIKLKEEKKIKVEELKIVLRRSSIVCAIPLRIGRRVRERRTEEKMVLRRSRRRRMRRTRRCQ